MKFIILSSISINSGTGIRIFNIAKNLSENNEVVLTGLGEKEGVKGKVKYVKIPKLRSRMLTHFMSLIVNFIVVLLNRADFVIASKPLPTSCLPAMLCKMIGRKIILDVDDLEHGYWKGTKFECPLKFFDRMFPKFFNRVTTHTKELKKYLNGLGVPNSRIIFLPQGIDYGVFKGVRKDIRKRLGLGKKKVIVYTAHLGPAAKLDFIFKVLKNITRKREGLMLLVVGGGECLEHYKNLARSMGIGKHVAFTGSVDHEEIPEYLAMSDVAVNYLESTPSNRYRSSIKVREYLASGVPVVCNIVSEDIEQFSRYLNSFETGNFEEMGKQILRVIKKPGKVKISMGKEFVKKWDWDIIVKDFERKLRGENIRS